MSLQSMRLCASYLTVLKGAYWTETALQELGRDYRNRQSQSYEERDGNQAHTAEGGFRFNEDQHPEEHDNTRAEKDPGKKVTLAQPIDAEPSQSLGMHAEL